MSVSIAGRRAEKNAVRKVQVVSLGCYSNNIGAFTLHMAAVDGQFRNVIKFLATLRNLMSVSIGGGWAGKTQ